MANLPALPFVRSGVTSGVSANKMYAEYQRAARENNNTAMRRQDFLRLYSQTRSLRGNAKNAVGAPRDVIPERTLIEPKNTIRATGYGQWATGFLRPRGGGELVQHPILVRSREPLTPSEAEAEAEKYFASSEDDYDRVLLGIVYMGSESYTPKGA